MALSANRFRPSGNRLRLNEKEIKSTDMPNYESKRCHGFYLLTNKVWACLVVGSRIVSGVADCIEVSGGA